MRRLPPAYGVADLRRYLEGSWRLHRVILDRKLRRCGRMQGEARFIPDGAGLSYEEQGELRFGAFRGPAVQRYLYRFPAPQQAEVRFADGRLFHALDLAGGTYRAEHLCAADLYRGWVALLGPDAWRTHWAVTGPRKDQLIVTCYRRAMVIPSPACGRGRDPPQAGG